jgi:hypothetical protein
MSGCSHEQRTDIVEATDQTVRWILIRDADRSTVEVGVHTRSNLRFEGRAALGTFLVDKDLILRFRGGARGPAIQPR